MRCFGNIANLYRRKVLYKKIKNSNRKFDTRGIKLHFASIEGYRIA